MQQGFGDRKVGLVTFNNEVTIIGDGTSVPQTIAGDKLYDYDYLFDNGEKQAQKLFTKNLKDTYGALG
jgi:hypothetical protein